MSKHMAKGGDGGGGGGGTLNVMPSRTSPTMAPTKHPSAPQSAKNNGLGSFVALEKRTCFQTCVIIFYHSCKMNYVICIVPY